MKQYIKYINSPIGKLTLASDGESLIGLWMKNQKYYGKQLVEPVEKDLPIFTKVEKWLNDYFEGKIPNIDFQIKPLGTPFRQKVWQHLLEIPYGKVVTYDFLATLMAHETGKKKCAQAIGQAVGHNPISLIIPCHRVVGKDGSLTGYAGGIDKKVFLLKMEGVQVENFYIPSNKMTV